MLAKVFVATLGSIVLLCGFAGSALPGPPPEGIENLKNLAGCFAVTYRFAEDGTHDLFNENYGLDTPITEWVGLERNTKDTFTLTHVSITDDGRAVPHWHEVWRHHPTQETWTQEVWSHTPGDDDRELRYGCTAPWKFNRWQCHAGPAAKPFRDYGAPFGFKRTDYAQLDRENILLVTENGWIQNEHNKKITSDGAVVSYELGWITYRRLGKHNCEAAFQQASRDTEG
jgi:hypothetical protein